MFRPLRRKDRAVSDRAWIDEVIRAGETMTVAINGTDGWPYAVPLSYGYDGRRLYFHGANAGLKVELLERDPHVCFNIYVPIGVVRGELAQNYSYDFKSVTGFGVATRATEQHDIETALDAIMDHYGGPKMIRPFPKEMIDAMWIGMIEIEHISGKDHAPKR